MQRCYRYSWRYRRKFLGDALMAVHPHHAVEPVIKPVRGSRSNSVSVKVSIPKSDSPVFVTSTSWAVVAGSYNIHHDQKIQTSAAGTSIDWRHGQRRVAVHTLPIKDLS